MAARRLTKKMYKHPKITKTPKITKYGLCNLYIYIYYKIKIEIVDASKMSFFVFQKFESILAFVGYLVQ